MHPQPPSLASTEIILHLQAYDTLNDQGAVEWMDEIGINC